MGHRVSNVSLGRDLNYRGFELCPAPQNAPADPLGALHHLPRLMRNRKVNPVGYMQADKFFYKLARQGWAKLRADPLSRLG